jgi:CxxC motif-containing protein
MRREYTCIICPVGCDMVAEIEDNEMVSLVGNKCAKGRVYVQQELTNPIRTIATSVLVKGGELPVASVRLSKPVPKASLFKVMAEAKKVILLAPVRIGQVVLKDIAGTGADLIVTKHVDAVH